MTLFRQKYRAESTRLPGWDCRAGGHYFVTICCTTGRELFFGEVVDGSMILSPLGRIVEVEWRGIEVRRRDVELGEWVVMPNHVHGILILRGRTPVETPHQQRDAVRPSNDASVINDRPDERIQRGVSTTSRLLAGSLGAIIGQFKSRSTKRIWSAGHRDFSWQPRFYDHIVRNEEALNQIRQYIAENPLKWELDKDNIDNLYM